jgi:hypothetical protein
VIEEGMAKFVRDSGKGCDCRIRVQGPSAGHNCYTFIVTYRPFRDIFPLSGFSPHMLCATLSMWRDSRKIQKCY